MLVEIREHAEIEGRHEYGDTLATIHLPEGPQFDAWGAITALAKALAPTAIVVDGVPQWTESRYGREPVPVR